MSTLSGGRTVRFAAFAFALSLWAGACGSGGSDEASRGTGVKDQLTPANGSAPQSESPGVAPSPTEAGAPATGVNPGPEPANPRPTDGPAPAALPAPSAAPVSKAAAGGPAAVRPAERPSSSERAGGPTAAGAYEPARGTGEAPANVPAPGGEDHSPIVIGSIGTLSGPAGGIIRQTAEGVQVWVAAVNARGGINGRVVKFFMADDGADPARYRAELQRLVESEKVVALVGNPDALTGSVGVRYVTDKRVPYIGGDGGGDWFYQSPMYFPQGTVGYTFAEAEVRDAALYAKEQHKSKFGTITCTEADFCRVADRIWNEQAKQVGLDPVYRGKTSLVQPDFTAECLAAQRAGVELLEVALDANSIRRLATSCARQAYRPLLGWPAGIAKDDQKAEPTLQGARISLFTFAWTQGDTPAAGEFQDAMRRYGKQLRPFTAGHAGGWVAAKMFEKALGAVPGKITREGVLVGLWTFKNETLGGLTAPLTFTRDQSAPRTRCWVTVVIKDSEFDVQRNGTFICG